MARRARSQHDLLITRLFGCRDLAVLRQCGVGRTTEKGQSMAKRKKASKIQKRGKLPKGKTAKRGKARKVAQAAKRTIAKAKPKRSPVKKAARKVKQPVAPVVETVAVEVIERPVALTDEASTGTAVL